LAGGEAGATDDRLEGWVERIPLGAVVTSHSFVDDLGRDRSRRAARLGGAAAGARHEAAEADEAPGLRLAAAQVDDGVEAPRIDRDAVARAPRGRHLGQLPAGLVLELDRMLLAVDPDDAAGPARLSRGSTGRAWLARIEDRELGRRLRLQREDRGGT